jgi:hypothetical protein
MFEISSDIRMFEIKKRHDDVRTPTPPRNLLAGQILPRFFRLSVPVLSWLDHALA